MSCHSETVATRCRQLDYLGINFNITSTCVSAAYFGFYNHPQLASRYITLILLSATLTFWTVLDQRADAPEGASRR